MVCLGFLNIPHLFAINFPSFSKKPLSLKSLYKYLIFESIIPSKELKLLPLNSQPIILKTGVNVSSSLIKTIPNL